MREHRIWNIHQKTVETCGQDGLKCADSDRVPPVCEAINANLLVPGADAISVFSPINAQNYLQQSPESRAIIRLPVMVCMLVA